VDKGQSTIECSAPYKYVEMYEVSGNHYNITQVDLLERFQLLSRGQAPSVRGAET